MPFVMPLHDPEQLKSGQVSPVVATRSFHALHSLGESSLDSYALSKKVASPRKKSLVKLARTGKRAPMTAPAPRRISKGAAPNSPLKKPA